MKYGLSSSTPPRMSAPSSVCSDDSFEIVNNELDVEDLKEDVFSIYKPKVTFHEVFDVYPMDSDIIARVTFDHDYLKSDQDTVVVLPIAWKSADQALCAANITGSYVRFDVKDLPKIGAEDKFYQLCYCTADKNVMGVSIPFSFREVHEDELVEFQKEQNKEFWTFRSRFAVLIDNYWNSLVEKSTIKVSEDKPTSILERESSVVENSMPESKSVNEKCTEEPCENANSTKSAGDSTTEKLMEAEHEILEHQNKKLKAVMFEMIRAISENDLETCHKRLSEAVYQSDELFSQDEFCGLHMLLKKYLDVTTRVKPSKDLPEVSEPHEDTNDSMDVFALKPITSEKILLFKIMEDENAELKKQFEEEARLHAEARNINKAFKDVLLKILRSTKLREQVQVVIEKSLPVISSVFEDEEVNDVRNILTRRRIDSLKELVEKQMCKFEVEFVGTPDGNILLANQCAKQISTEASKTTTVHESVKKWEAKIAVLVEERDKLLTEVNEQQAIIKNLNEQLINQRQSEVEKMIAVTNNMRDQYIKNIIQLTDSNKVMAQKLTEKDKEIETLNTNLLDASKLLTENEREIRDLKARDHTFMGFLERRNLKRISELGETLQEMYSKIWAERQESAKLKDDLLTTQTLLNSLCDELEKSSCKKSMENSAQTGEDVSNVSGTSSMSSPEQLIPEVPSTSAGFRRIKQREQALATKLVEMSADLEKMRIIHEKTKSNLESRLKDGAKQYAKLYMKYDKLVKRIQSRSREPSN